MDTVRVKAENEQLKNTIVAQRQQHELSIKELEHQLEVAKLGQKDVQYEGELGFKYYHADLQATIAREQMNLNKDRGNEQTGDTASS